MKFQRESLRGLIELIEQEVAVEEGLYTARAICAVAIGLADVVDELRLFTASAQAKDGQKMITFKIEKHKRRAFDQVVEIWSNDKLIASLYGIDGECGVKLVSHHMPNPPDLRVEVRRDFPTSLEVRFHKEGEIADGQ